jgi:hypothetical protein
MPSAYFNINIPAPREPEKAHFQPKVEQSNRAKIVGVDDCKEPLASARSGYCSESESEAHGYSGHGVIDQTVSTFIRWTQ